jgi:hypothetical protein
MYFSDPNDIKLQIHDTKNRQVAGVCPEVEHLPSKRSWVFPELQGKKRRKNRKISEHMENNQHAAK